MIEAGKVKSIVDRVYTMEQAPEAHHRVETEERLGAVVIVAWVMTLRLEMLGN